MTVQKIDAMTDYGDDLAEFIAHDTPQERQQLFLASLAHSIADVCHDQRAKAPGVDVHFMITLPLGERAGDPVQEAALVLVYLRELNIEAEPGLTYSDSRLWEIVAHAPQPERGEQYNAGYEVAELPVTRRTTD